MEAEAFELNRLTQQNLNLVNPYKKPRTENEKLRKNLEENVYEEKFNECTQNLAELGDNADQLFNLIEQQSDVSNDLIVLARRLLDKLENKNALSKYRDWITRNWITLFNKCLQAELDWDVWSKSQKAVYKKVKFENANYSTSEKGCVSELEIALKNVSMTLKDYELLMLMKHKSNNEFHGDRSLTQTAAQEELNTSFPESMEPFKNALNKLFEALDIFNSEGV